MRQVAAVHGTRTMEHISGPYFLFRAFVSLGAYYTVLPH